LTITARRLAKKNVFVKRLDVVETLGSTTAIATDKTGTLTENRMTVSHLWYDFHSHNRDRLTERKSVAFKNESFNRLYRIAALCNRAHWEEDPDAPAEPERNSVRPSMIQRLLTQLHSLTWPVTSVPQVSRHNRSLEVVRKSMEVRRSMEMRRSGENISIDAVRKSVEMSRPRMSAEYGDHPTGRRSVEYTRDYSRMKIVGDASETALFRFCNEMKDIEAFQSDSAKVFEIPFNSTNKWQLSIHKVEVRSGHYIKERRLLVMKGAPEVIMARCSYYFHKGEKREVDDKFKEEWDSAYKRFGTYGERVLGFAELELDPKIYKSSMDKEYNAQKNNFPTDGLTFVGLISLLDPPRQGVKQAVSDCHTAGIRVIMVTGDHPFTAGSFFSVTCILVSELLTQECYQYYRGHRKEGRDSW
jgi:magnesium-transporting ATPase (P-type)